MSDSKIKKKRRTGSKARELVLEQEMQLKESQAQSRGEDNNKTNKTIQSHYAFNKPIIPPVSPARFYIFYFKKNENTWMI